MYVMSASFSLNAKSLFYLSFKLQKKKEREKEMYIKKFKLNNQKAYDHNCDMEPILLD